MTNRSSGLPDDSSPDLQGDWNLYGDWNPLPDDSREQRPEEDSLQAYIEPSSSSPPTSSPIPTPSSPDPVAGDEEPASRPPQRPAEDAELLDAFTLEERTDEPDIAPVAETDPEEPSVKPEGASPRRLPKPGEVMAGFLIVGELGRGAFARVYLARQENLGHRLVALKISPAEGDEPEILARLQHSHIVPIHSVHDDPVSGLRIICMPYLGGANLAQVLEAVVARAIAPTHGRSLVDALDSVSQRLQSTTGLTRSTRSFLSGGVSPYALTRLPSELEGPAAATDSGLGKPSDEPVSFILQTFPVDTTRSHGAIQSLWTRISGRSRPTAPTSPDSVEPHPDQPSRQFLREANHIQAAVWIIARLAEGLEHAHARGLVHRDLKPSNILITDDGTPMLLDFNLSTPRRIHSKEEGTKVVLGGTLPYMAPEHLDAFYPQGTTPPEAVGERADLYALCLILFEIIAGELPFPEHPASHPLAPIIQKMIAERHRTVPSLRAACPEVPWSLDSIVAKGLDPEPQRRYAHARDLAEDLRRFLDDLPLKFAPEPSPRERVAKWIRRHPRTTSSTSVALLALVLLCAAGGTIALLSNSLQGVSARLRFRNFQSEFSECQLRLNTTSGPREHLTTGIKMAQRALEREGQGLWDPTQKGAWTRWLEPKDQQLLREQMVELILLEARARTYLANQGGSEDIQRRALEWAIKWLNRAERIDPQPTPALYGDRARYFAALGQAKEAGLDRAREAAAPPRNSRDFALLGTSLMVKRDWPRAEVALLRAVELDPRRFWAWFGLGYCRFEQGRYLEAAGDFGTCTALEPEFAWPYMNQGLALACAGRLNGAFNAYNQALKKNPRFTEALVNRALTRLELDDLTGAEGDLNRAIELGRREPNVLAARGEVLARLGRRDEAERLYDSLLEAEPRNQAIRIARAVLRLKTDPASARQDLEQVLALNPRNARALYVLARLVQPDDRRRALEYVDRALDADPNLADALQLRALLRARLGLLSAREDVDRLVQAPTAAQLYNAACAMAILSETAAEPRFAERALSLLNRALDAGFPSTRAAADPDLKPLHSRPEFQALIQRDRTAPPPS